MKLRGTHRETPMDLCPSTHGVSFQRGVREASSSLKTSKARLTQRWVLRWAGETRGCTLCLILKKRTSQSWEATPPSRLLSANPKKAPVSVGGTPDAIQRRPLKQAADE